MIIKERLEQTKYGFVTDYVGDIINFLINKPKIYRISYYPQKDIYAICDGYDTIHLTNDYSLKELGYDYEVLSKDSINFLFVPTDLIDDKKKWEVEGFGDERAYLTPITTGYIVTYSSYELKTQMSELYNILQRKHLFVDRKPKKDILFPEFNLNNYDAYNYIGENTIAYIRGASIKLLMNTPEKQMNALRQLKHYMDTHELPKGFIERYWIPPRDDELKEIEQQLNKRYKELNESALKLKIREINTMLK